MRSWSSRVVPTLTGLALSLAVAIALFAAAGAPPFEALRLLVQGAVGSSAKLGDTFTAWVPLTLAAAGLVVTFAAGMWNIGVEGQIIAGAIAATWVARTVPGPGIVIIPLAIVAGAVGGAAWALLAGVLRTKGKVNEIFGGLGLDFLAAGLATYLVIGPWKREGIASTSGTDLFRQEAWMPTIAGTRLSPVAVVLAIAAVIGVWILFRGTRFGLRLKAVGRSRDSAYLMGIPVDRYLLGAFALGGALAGIAGTVQVTAFHHKLVPAISGGYGFLGILVVLLAGYSARAIAPIAFFFVAVSVGATQLELRLNLDSSIGGVIQGAVVLFVMLAGGVAARRRLRRADALAAEVVAVTEEAAVTDTGASAGGGG